MTGQGPTSFALIIGAMKSGTTTLFDLLAQHPEIAQCRTKEPDFFARESEPLTVWNQYIGLWDWAPKHHRIALEASVAYAKAPWVADVPRRISTIEGAQFRFIYVLRHPLRRIESQVRHSIFAGWGKSLDDGGLTADLLDFSRYAMQLRQYWEYFPKEKFLILTLEELEENPGHVLRRCCQFLGVDDNFVFEGETARKNVGDLYTVAPSVKVVVANPLLRRVAQAILPRAAYQGVRALIGRTFGGTKKAGRWRLNEAEESAVLSQLAEDLQVLNSEFGIDTERRWSIRSSGPTSR